MRKELPFYFPPAMLSARLVVGLYPTAVALPAVRHRVALSAEAEVEGQKVDDLLTELIRSVEIPRL